jgi:hypothetical protein
MSERWISVELSETKDVLSVRHGETFFKEETDKMMSVAYKMISSFAERASTTRTDPERTELFQSYRKALARLEFQLRL